MFSSWIFFSIGFEETCIVEVYVNGISFAVNRRNWIVVEWKERNVFIYSVALLIPAPVIANWQSASGREGESKTCMIRFSPRPLRSLNLVVEAWAIMLPPIGFVVSVANGGKKTLGSLTTWFVINTATPNSSAIRVSWRRN